MKAIRLCILCLLVATGAAAQDAFYEIFSYQYEIPTVGIDDGSVTLQASLYPQAYRFESAAADQRWVGRNDSALVAFWHQRGDTVLHILRELSGIPWIEERFDIHLIRYYPTEGSGNPTIVAVGGIRQGNLIEAAPTGHHQQFNLIYQLARRMLGQANRPSDSVLLPVAYHPMMKPGPYRFDNLAMLLTINTCHNLFGIDTTAEVWESAFWRNRTPGRYVLEQYMLNTWILTPQQPLETWVLNEPYGSSLVSASRPPRRPRQQRPESGRKYIEGLPLKGKLGFSVTVDASNFVTVDQIDAYRLAYACGLREGDQIRRVDGHLVRTHKAVVEKILEGLELNGGATVQIQRDGGIESVVIVPLMLPFMDDEGLYPEEDTVDPYADPYYDEYYYQPDDSDSTMPEPAPEP